MKARSVGVLLFLALPFFTSLGVPSVWDSNEAYYVQTPREMVERGDWLVPYFNAEPRLNKPPLAYWVVAAFYRCFGVSFWWERLVMAVLAYACLWVVFWMGRILFSEPTALLAAGIFATSFRFLMLSRRLLIDILLLFCVLVAIACFLHWWRNGGRKAFLSSSLFFGLGFLAKGPVVLLPAAALFLYLFLSGQRARLRSAPWPLATLLFLSVSSSWFLVLGFQQGWDAVANFLWTENLGRFTHIQFGPERGALFYVGAFFVDYFPWSFLFPGAVLESVRSWRRKDLAGEDVRNAGVAASDARDSGLSGSPTSIGLLGCWMLIYLLVFSFSQNKQEYYILPIYPAASLWLAYYLRRALPGLALRLPIAAVGALLGILLFVLAGSLFSEAWGWWIPFIPFAGFIWVAARGQAERMVWTLCLFYFSVFTLHLGPLDKYRPVHHLARAIQEQAPPDGNFLAGYYRYSAPSLTYYLNQPILETYRYQETVDTLRRDSPVYLIVGASDYEELRQAVGPRLKIVEVRPNLYTNGRKLITGLISGRKISADTWTRPIYLVSNQGE